MKILVFNNGYLDGGLSGGDKHVIDIAEVWMKEHQVAFMLPDYVADRIPNGIETIKYHSFMPKSPLAIMFAYMCRLFRAINVAWGRPADVVVTSVGLFDIIPAVICKMRHGSKTAVYVYHLIPKRKGRNILQAALFLLSRIVQSFSMYWFKKCDIILVCNEFVKEALVQRGFPSEQVTVTRLAVNVDGVRNAPPVKNIRPFLSDV